MKQAKVIAIANQKGGVGKTTTTRNLGTALARLNKKVLMIDFDPQGNLSTCCGVEEISDLKDTIADMILNMIDNEMILNKSLNVNIISVEKNLDLLPANGKLTNAMNALNSVNLGSESVLKMLLENYISKYDYILIDCQPSIDLLPINALIASDSVIIAMQPDKLNLEGVKSIIRTMTVVKRGYNRNLSILGILETMYDKRTKETRIIEQEILELFDNKIKLFDTKIPISTKVKESNRLGISILDHDSSGKVAEAYCALALEVIR